MAMGSPDSVNGHCRASERRKGGAAECETRCQAKRGGPGFRALLAYYSFLTITYL